MLHLISHLPTNISGITRYSSSQKKKQEGRVVVTFPPSPRYSRHCEGHLAHVNVDTYSLSLIEWSTDIEVVIKGYKLRDIKKVINFSILYCRHSLFFPPPDGASNSSFSSLPFAKLDTKILIAKIFLIKSHFYTLVCHTNVIINKLQT